MVHTPLSISETDQDQLGSTINMQPGGATSGVADKLAPGAKAEDRPIIDASIPQGDNIQPVTSRLDDRQGGGRRSRGEGGHQWLYDGFYSVHA